MKRVLARLLAFALIAGFPASGAIPERAAKTPLEVTLRALLANPGSYDHKLIRVTGVVSHGFEDFTLSDPTLVTYNAVWLEYGGWVASNTIYCCGSTPGASRGEVLTIDNIRIPLRKDKQFRRFDRLLKRSPKVVVRATIVGRFFAGKRTIDSNGETWGGYGHFGCCSLLVIQQVVAVGPTTPVPRRRRTTGCSGAGANECFSTSAWFARRPAEPSVSWAAFPWSGVIAK